MKFHYFRRDNSDSMKTYELINLPKIFDPRGNLTFIQYPNQIPFQIKRVFWTYDVPGGEQRGGHAYKSQNEIIVALSGSFDVVHTLPDGTKQTISLNRSYHALLLPALTWRHLDNFSTNAICLHLSDKEFDPSDYLRDFEEYKSLSNVKI
ncbi:MAG: sugar 3,4-ketoisomerase [Algoriphagus aquaeductus]|uniref:sugar 3,4-ketoisomerase n=1 Tax=Algoriphagus TaxID=246875 RepID=UPI0021026149|nr:FdtA/QdtA family cupin domain-containing protein [Algoriphagus sp. AK58]